MSEEDRIRFAVLEKNYGLSLDQAESLIRKFGDDIKSISGLGENADYYRKNTKDMLLALEIPHFIGYDNPEVNAGNMQTTGFDIEVGWRD